MYRKDLFWDPLLYILYSDKQPSLTEGWCPLVISKKTDTVIKQQIGRSLDSFSLCFSQNDVVMNVDKTQILFFFLQLENWYNTFTSSLAKQTVFKLNLFNTTYYNTSTNTVTEVTPCTTHTPLQATCFGIQVMIHNIC